MPTKFVTNPRRPAAKKPRVAKSRTASKPRVAKRNPQHTGMSEADRRELMRLRAEMEAARAAFEAKQDRLAEMAARTKRHLVKTTGTSRGNPRRKSPPKGFRIAGPAVKTMVGGLRISKADAQRLKDMMDTGAPRILHAADRMMNGYGVERIPGRPGLMYVNMGDTYDTTLIYDYKTNRFVVSSWGDIVERQPRRFAD